MSDSETEQWPGEGRWLQFGTTIEYTFLVSGGEPAPSTGSHVLDSGDFTAAGPGETAGTS